MRAGRAPHPRRWPPSHLAPMLAVAAPLPAESGAFAFEYKWDGMRALVAVRDGRVRILSRNGLDQAERFPELAPIADSLRGRMVVLDGEIVALDPGGRPDFGRLQVRFGLTRLPDIERLARLQPVHFLAFDLLHLDGEDLVDLSYVERRRRLEALRFQGPSWATPPVSMGDGDGMLAASRDLALEGLVAKRLDSTYQPGARSAAWLKIRNRNRQEFVVGGWTEGEGSRQGTFGSLLVGVHGGRDMRRGRPARRRQPERAERNWSERGSSERGPASERGAATERGASERGEATVGSGARSGLRFVGKVGSGFTDDDVRRLQRALAPLAATDNPFGPGGDGGTVRGAVHFVEPRLVVEVEFNGLTRHGQLRQASFKGLRTDKEAGEVVWEQAEPLEPTSEPAAERSRMKGAQTRLAASTGRAKPPKGV